MTEVTIYHNPRCTKSRQALAIAEKAGATGDIQVNVVRYLDDPPTAAELKAILSKLEDEPSKLVRRERWSELSVVADDVATPGGVTDVLVRHPELMERPLVVAADRAFIGRPTERVAAFFGVAGANA